MQELRRVRSGALSEAKHLVSNEPPPLLHVAVKTFINQCCYLKNVSFVHSRNAAGDHARCVGRPMVIREPQGRKLSSTGLRVGFVSSIDYLIMMRA